MSTTLAEGVAAGVKAVHKDPVVTQLVEQLGQLMHPWFSRQGWEILETEMLGSYMLNGNLGWRGVFFALDVPGRKYPLRVVAEVRTCALGTTMVASLRLRKDSPNGYQGWLNRDSSPVEVDYAAHKGEYKLQLLVQKLRTLLNIPEDAEQLESTAVLALLDSVMAEEMVSPVV